MKKIIALSIGLIYGTAFAAQEPTKEQITEKATTEQTEVKSVETKPVKAPVKKKTVKKQVKETQVKAEAPVIVVTDYYHVPKGSDENNADWKNKITYDDVDVFIERTASQPLNISFVDKRTNQLLDPHYLKQMDNFKSDVNITEMDSTLENIVTDTINFNGVPQKISFESIRDGRACSIVFVTYHLKTQAEEKTLVKYIDGSNNLSNQIPAGCPIWQDNKETTFYTPAGNIVDIGYNRKVMAENRVGLSVHFTRDGREFFPNLPYTYAVDKKLTKLHYLMPIYHSKNPYFGITYNQPLPAGDYVLLLGIKMDGMTDLVRTSFATR